eukprot:766882-Hanusia_phi.AAC.2
MASILLSNLRESPVLDSPSASKSDQGPKTDCIKANACLLSDFALYPRESHQMKLKTFEISEFRIGQPMITVLEEMNQPDGAEESEQQVTKRKAEELGLDEKELLAAEILSASFGGGSDRVVGSKSGRSKAARTSDGRGMGNGSRNSNRANVSSEGGEKDSAGGRINNRRQSGSDNAPSAPIVEWARKVVDFLEVNGQDLLHAICAHYRIEFSGDIRSIRDYSIEQLAHNAIFNPALPKTSGRLPKMLRDVDGVADWNMTFLKNKAGLSQLGRLLFCQSLVCRHFPSCKGHSNAAWRPVVLGVQMLLLLRFLFQWSLHEAQCHAPAGSLTRRCLSAPCSLLPPCRLGVGKR